MAFIFQSNGMKKSAANSSLCADRFSQLEIERRYNELMQWGVEAQAEALANHYLSMAQQAKDLYEVVQYRRLCNDPKHRYDSIELLCRLVKDLKRNHAHDLGIELKWETKA